MSQPPRDRMPVRSVSQGGPPERPSGRPPGTAGPGAPQRPRTTRSAQAPPPPPPQRQDPFPYVMGGIIGALVVGLVLVVFLLLNNNQSPGVTGAGSNSTGNVPNAQPTSAAGVIDTEVDTQPDAEPPPRMPLDEFKALYDDPAKRPLVVDVRAAEAYQQGHIEGAVNIPEAEVSARLAEFPKDRLIVAYCQ